ncbi:MAG TPA: 30S ribosome-binding factor RbfA [Candidatus Limnocylindrales bacterium]|jgi:ribosome-binding factor A|nr:30S ribosome-binding factor RbfA [Candidatus Limnocylindrales bacterium]
MAAGRRAERVGRQVVQALAAAASSGVGDPRLAGITFTSATASDDLRNVRVFYSVFGDDAAIAAAREGLKAASGYLRREVSHRLALRYAPSLHFEFDESLRTAERIDKLLREGEGHAAAGEPSDDPRESELDTEEDS